MSASPSGSDQAGPSSGLRRKAVLNVPEGSQPIVEAPDLDPNDARTGETTRDLWEAAKVTMTPDGMGEILNRLILQRIKPTEDLKNIGNVPCARSALLTGMAGGAGFGAVTFLSRRSGWRYVRPGRSAAELARTLQEWDLQQIGRYSPSSVFLP